MSDLPNWVYDVVIELKRWRDTHPKLHAQFTGSNEWQRVDDCGCKPLDHVPAEVIEQARVIERYNRDR